MATNQSEEYFFHQRCEKNGNKHRNGFWILIGCLRRRVQNALFESTICMCLQKRESRR